MEHIVQGFSLIARNRKLWRYILRPMALSALIYFLVSILSFFGLVPLATRILAGMGLSTTAASSLSLVLFVVLWFFISSFLFLSIFSFMSSLLWDKLSEEVEEHLTGSAPTCTLPRSVVVSDGIKRGILAVCVAILSFCCGWVVPVVLGVILAGWLGLLDFTSSTFIRYNVTLGPQLRQVMKLKGWPGFLIGSGLISLIPFVNVLMLPAMVAAGTIMCVKSDTFPPVRQ